MGGSVLIIDDEEGLRKLLSRIVRLEGYEVIEAESLTAARNVLKRKAIDVVLCDVKLPDGNGVDFVKELKTGYSHLEVILITAFGNIADGVQSIKQGAFDYLTKGNDNDRIIPLLAQATDRVKEHRAQAVKVNAQSSTSFSSIIGHSAILQQTIRLAKKIAPTTSTVLLLGETGTGKEVFAGAIHGGSSCGEGPFVAINCSAFSRELLEGELFGHKAGAYTGATKDKKGLIETAHGGTLLLDEIGEMDLDLQAKLLRVLENGEFIKLGDTKVTRVSVRVIAATNRDLQREVEEGRFREDLFYRLNTFTISLPPLRERREDIEALALHFLNKIATRENKVPPSLSNEALQAMKNYSWKGNIRELRNVVERSVILADGDTIGLQDLPTDLQHTQRSSSTFALADVEKEHIRKILSYTGGNKAKAAQLLNIGVATLYRKLDEYGFAK